MQVDCEHFLHPSRVGVLTNTRTHDEFARTTCSLVSPLLLPARNTNEGWAKILHFIRVIMRDQH
ncbi:MAG: hypothetical protein ACOYXT_01605 [Bacteroidota bacterium]